MKTIIFFDVDNTIYNNNLGKIPEQTKKLLLELSKRDDVILGLATGRGYKKLEVIQEVVSFFKYKVLLNGSIIFKDEQVIYDHPILHEDIEEALSIARGHQFNIGMVGLDDEAVNSWDTKVEDGMKQLRGKTPKVDRDFHNKNKVYQFWLFGENEKEILDTALQLPKFQVYPWHKGGADFIYPSINKAFGIRKAVEHETDFRLICVGDGANDVKMIEMADIGIAMSNTRFDELKEKAKHLAPHIKEDQLYDFFKSINLI